MTQLRTLIAILAAVSLPAIAAESSPASDGNHDGHKSRAEKEAAAVARAKKEGKAKPKAVRPEQSSAERTADPHPLEHDKPTGAPTR